MSALTELLHPKEAPDVPETAAQTAGEHRLPLAGAPPRWDPESFATQQIRGLVRQVFYPGWPRPARQVVFSGVDQSTEIAEVCAGVGKALAAQMPGTVCVVEADLRLAEAPRVPGGNGGPPAARVLRQVSRQISDHLWHMPAQVFLSQAGEVFSAAWLRDRLGELRREFDYTIFHAPPAGLSSEAVLLGHLCDGLILVLEAHSTRRVAARKTKELLLAANVRLLGTVLNQRTFPIPQMLYHRL